ncbi:MAG: hypothetical protein H7A24_07435 [Leptospiraceae bacterium]|nr:hypothetical protein [Leptospiraceae bacterium]MCP5511696.1 hypothetical protein [Leptospiraceae bacterium]
MKSVEYSNEQLTYKMSGNTKGKLLAMILLGVISTVLSFFVLHEPSRSGHSNAGWSVLLIGVFLALGVSIAGLFFTAISHITGSKWSITVRRLAEAFSKFLPVGIVLLAVIVFFGVHDLYEWSHTEVVAKDHLLQHKSGWLNVPFFPIRLLVITGIWFFFGHLFLKNSVSQDESKDINLSLKNNGLSAKFILVFALTFSIVAYDLLMSLTPHWFSTMWAVYIFAGIYQSTFAVMLILIYHLKKNGYYGDAVNENHIHDLAKFMMSFCIFWAYVGFSQFMLIWYANMPEETFWFEQRLIGGWAPISYAIPFIKFVIPFLLLVNRPNKRNIDFLVKVSSWILFTEFVELFWIVFPSNYETFSMTSMVLAFGGTIGVMGLFGFMVLKGLEKYKLIPVGDPRLEDCLHHHQ